MNREELQEALNELKDLVHSELDGTKMLNKHLVYCNTLQDFIDQNKSLTLEECIKEWEEKGYIVRNDLIIISIYVKPKTKASPPIITFDKGDKTFYSVIWLDYNILLLIFKTLKALEKIKK